MSFKDDIQTIAKTKELQDGVNKARQEAAAAQKSAIDAVRRLSYKAPGGNTNTVAGAPAGGPSKDGNDIDKLIPRNEPYLESVIPGISFGQNANYGTSSLPPASEEVIKTDLSKSAVTGMPSGSDILERAQFGAQNPTIQAAFDAIDARTDLSPAEKDAAKQKLMLDVQNTLANIEQDGGYFTVKDLMDGKSFVPSIGQLLNGVIGFDGNGELNADGSMKSVLVSLRGVFPTPSLADTESAGQQPWELAEDPPEALYWTLGYKYKAGPSTYFAGGLATANVAAGGLLPPLINDAVVGYNNPAFHYTVTATRNFTASLAAGILSQYNYEVYLEYVAPGDPLNSGWISANAGVTRTACTPGAEASCTIANPSAASWPRTGSYVMAFDVNHDGQFNYSQYDSEAPQRYGFGVATVELKAGDGVNVIDTSVTSLSTISGGGFTISRPLDGPNGKAQYYGGDGRLKAIIKNSEINQYINPILPL